VPKIGEEWSLKNKLLTVAFVDGALALVTASGVGVFDSEQSKAALVRSSCFGSFPKGLAITRA
jgi:hypothetical protein